MKPLAAFLALYLCAAPAFPAETDKPARVILVGDSTMASRTGYGDALCARFQPQVACINLARGGRSSGSFRAEGRWDEVRALLKDGGARTTYVLVQFGHNDQPGKPGRSTDLVRDFPGNIARYAEEVRAQGGVPVLVTPLTRRIFKSAYLRDDLAPWAAAIRSVAAERRVALVDLHRISAAAVQAMGQDEADTLAQAPKPAAAPPTVPTAAVSTAAVSTAAVSTAAVSTAASEPQGAPKIAFDYTHVGAKGAALFSGMVADELGRLFPELGARMTASARQP